MKDILTSLLGLPQPTRRSSTETEWTDDCDADELNEDDDDCEEEPPAQDAALVERDGMRTMERFQRKLLALSCGAWWVVSCLRVNLSRR